MASVLRFAEECPQLALPNGVPSIHFSNALSCGWYARRFCIWRWLGLLFLLATALATLGFGEHYLFDLIVAVPYTVGVVRLAAFVKARGSRPIAAQIAPITAP